MAKPWSFRSELFETQPYKRALEINNAKAIEVGGCWSSTDVCDDTQCWCADESLRLAKLELSEATRP